VSIFDSVESDQFFILLVHLHFAFWPFKIYLPLIGGSSNNQSCKIEVEKLVTFGVLRLLFMKNLLKTEVKIYNMCYEF